MKKYKWAVIGPGKIAHKFVKDLLLLPNAELYAVASRSEGNAKNFAGQYGAEKFYGDHQQMLIDNEIDAVYIATPHAYHKKFAIDCLNAGIPVLCEKPMAIDLDDVKEMVDLAREKQVFLMEAMWTSCLPHFQFVKQMVDRKELGKVNYLRSDFGFKARFDPAGRLFNKQLGGGSLLDIGIYPVYAALSLLGFPDKLQATAEMSSTGVDNQTHALCSYRDGAVAVLSATFLNTTATETLIHCENGYIKINGRWHEPSTVEVVSENDSSHHQFEVQGHGYQFEAKEMMECLDQDKKESVSMPLGDSIKLAEMLEWIKEEIKLSYK
ncbi:MAG: Gfo/Idh/MocA family oxidoreductase [Bacteroidota bacterium]